jgi:hypothetical protein
MCPAFAGVSISICHSGLDPESRYALHSLGILNQVQDDMSCCSCSDAFSKHLVILMPIFSFVNATFRLM